MTTDVLSDRPRWLPIQDMRVAQFLATLKCRWDAPQTVRLTVQTQAISRSARARVLCALHLFEHDAHITLDLLHMTERRHALGLESILQSPRLVLGAQAVRGKAWRDLDTHNHSTTCHSSYILVPAVLLCLIYIVSIVPMQESTLPAAMRNTTRRRLPAVPSSTGTLLRTPRL